MLGTATGATWAAAITQARSDKREKAARKRERKRERERWDREDKQNVADQQRQVYLDFYTALQEASVAVTASRSGTGLEAAAAAVGVALDNTHPLHIFGSSEVFQAGSEAAFWLSRWCQTDLDDGGRAGVMSARFGEWENRLRAAIRVDLHLPALSDAPPFQMETRDDA